MGTTYVQLERLSVTSSLPFDTIVARLEAAVSRPDPAAFMQEMAAAASFPELERTIQNALGSSVFMQFLRLDLGMVLRKQTGLSTPRMLRFLIGNPLVMKEMARHVPDAGSYAPLTILVDERPDGVHLSYDRMASLLAPYGNSEALAVARDLDGKIETLLQAAAAEP